MTNEMILFLDIETCPEQENFLDLSLDGQAAFSKKFQSAVDKGDYASMDEAYTKNASFMAEFSKVVCVAVGRIFSADPTDLTKSKVLKMYTLTGEEDAILTRLAKALTGGGPGKLGPDFICAHNGKLFDFPFLARRYAIRGIRIPTILDVRFRKPWETSWLDTAEMWQFSDRRHYVSLITLAYVFGLKSPKETMHGGEVAGAFRAGEIKKIANYCLDDLVTLVNIYMCMMLDPIFETNIERIEL
jgi:DNA polymerase elongation subunit (family B)